MHLVFMFLFGIPLMVLAFWILVGLPFRMVVDGLAEGAPGLAAVGVVYLLIVWGGILTLVRH